MDKLEPLGLDDTNIDIAWVTGYETSRPLKQNAGRQLDKTYNFYRVILHMLILVLLNIREVVESVSLSCIT